VTMGKCETGVPDAWGTQLTMLFEHEIVTLFAEADVSILSKASAALVLYDHLRSFMALKSSLKTSEPQSDALLPAHEALLNYTARLFMTAHQALLNNGQKDSPAKPLRGWRASRQHKTLAPTKEFLLEWQLARLRAARDRLIMELADVSEKNDQLFQGLGLPEAVRAEVESARLRVSEIWRDLPAVLWESPAAAEVRGKVAA